MCDNVHVFSFTGIVDMGTAGKVFVHAMALYGEWEWEQSLTVYKIMFPLTCVI